MDQPSYRGKQIMKWIWGRGVSDFELMTNVSKVLRTKLGQKYRVSRLKSGRPCKALTVQGSFCSALVTAR